MNNVMAIIAAVIVISFPFHVILRRLKSTGLQQPGWKKMVKFFLLFFHFFCVGCSLFIILIWLSGRFTIKAKQSEAKTNLGAIYVAQLRYFSDHHSYAGGPETFKLINWEPAGMTRYAYYCGEDMIKNKLPSGRATIPLPGRDWPYENIPASSATSFTCMAIGNDDSDDTLDVWSINDGKVLRNELNDVDK